MDVLLNDKVLHLDDQKHSSDKLGGGEGKVYIYESNSCAKIYHKRILDTYDKQAKILAFCDKFEELNYGFIANPQYPVFTGDSEKDFCGFSMNFFPDCIDMFEVQYDSNEQKYPNNLTDEDAVSFIQSLFGSLKTLHRARIILGDINPGNILFNVRTKKPVIVDIDSAQIGNFRSVAKTDDYFDPNVEIDIHDDESYYSYTTDSDIFGMTALSFEFVTGLNPFDVATQSELTLEQNITRGNSYIKYHNLIKRGNKVFEIENDEGCQYCCARLDHLLEHHPKLYHHFASVLVYKKREYFLAPNFWKVRSGKRTVRRKKWSDYRGNKHIPKARKNDPAELNHFMNTYNINLRELLS